MIKPEMMKEKLDETNKRLLGLDKEVAIPLEKIYENGYVLSTLFQ